ncbi:PIN domain nuclease, a component of toxin-antitoxin system (PIN domain) [Devosia lucknowensis]|uniref:PIN domain nuclease, a component of toxin-antitoxin system (PIN domain) n=1 Tax=Devosia lucknowensis TaxID=1096929 RepID=A0A1Y6G8F5_9HYPH|nr:PIN domain nuclease, a component of toxin-antitoxin system (PIN domain) [Devosia lucknowensis]
MLDTHVWAWSLADDKRLSSRAFDAIAAAEAVSVSAISLYEIGQKVRLGKWPEMEPHFLDLDKFAARQGVELLAVWPSACLVGAAFQWNHRDPFDRIIGATALVGEYTLISADMIFDELADYPGWQGRLW